MGPPLTAKKSVEKNVEKDPFIVTITNNNEEHSKILVKAFNADEQVKTSSNCLRLHTMSLIIGIFLMVLGLVCFAVSSHLESLFVHIVQGHTALSVGGPMFTAWLTPPIVPLLKVYVFNITNGAQVLQVEDPVTQELGPYVYSATHIRTVAQAGEDSLAFLSRTNYQFQPHLSVGIVYTVHSIVYYAGVSRPRVRQPHCAEHGDGDGVQQGQELPGDGEEWSGVSPAAECGQGQACSYRYSGRISFWL